MDGTSTTEMFGGPYHRALVLKVALPLAGVLALAAWFIHYRYTGPISPRGITASSMPGLVMNAVFGYLLGAAIYMLWLLLHWRKLRKHWVPCLNCGYSLRRLPRQGHCPECGCEFDRAQTAACWRELVATFARRERLVRWSIAPRTPPVNSTRESA